MGRDDLSYRDSSDGEYRTFRGRRFSVKKFGFGILFGALTICFALAFFIYTQFRIDVPPYHIAVLTTKTGTDLSNGQEIAPDESHKGLQKKVLQEGRYFYNCYNWDWEIYPMVVIPKGKMGVRVRLHGEDLPRGHFVAKKEDQKGIVKDVLNPARYTLNAEVIDGDTKQVIGQRRAKSDYLEIIELWSPKTIPAGYKGVVTNLAGDLPETANTLLVKEGFRGTQTETLKPGTHYLNPYLYRINSIDCRSQRFNLAQGTNDMTFPSKDGFPISLDGIIEFRVTPERAAEVYVTYNDITNDTAESGAARIAEEIISKVILPNARAFCRLQGAKSSAREFIDGETRAVFQKAFQDSIRETCSEQGIEIVQALITKIKPPDAIAKPLRDREVARQTLAQYKQQKEQQVQEANLATEAAKVTQRTMLVEARREVIKVITEAEEKQVVALEGANRDKEVAALELEAAKDQARAIVSEKTAEAAIISYENIADAAGWKIAVEALGGKGQTFSTYVLYKKLAPGFKKIMANTADSPLMSIFENFGEAKQTSVPVPQTKNVDVPKEKPTE